MIEELEPVWVFHSDPFGPEWDQFRIVTLPDRSRRLVSYLDLYNEMVLYKLTGRIPDLLRRRS